ncbi:hypothetical protein SAMN05216266_10555 [Amycolatopsis marina]|uniref:DUF4386 domain-containing protein n=1 Tax=Amycolatopsis marina TaxID=490629 RepID=A0A1I0YG69_9PSEU|nr:hypothetical protein [Amycolatopsis marina]SFB12349.1 hypothetical protein SAMN05216266_10555 [Amycolatopsis marina]
MTTIATTRTRLGAVAVALAPAVMFAALVSHPYLARLPDAPAVAEAVAENTTRWGFVHLLTSVGSALIALAFLAVRAHLRNAGEDRFSAWALPFTIIGSALYGLVPGLEFAPMAAARADGDAAAAQAILEPWLIAILATSVFIFAIGTFGFARAIADSQILSRPWTRLVVGALVVLAVSRFVPLGAVQFYVQAPAGLVALWPLANQMWRAPAIAPAVPGSPVTAG